MRREAGLRKANKEGPGRNSLQLVAVLATAMEEGRGRQKSRNHNTVKLFLDGSQKPVEQAVSTDRRQSRRAARSLARYHIPSLR